MIDVKPTHQREIYDGSSDQSVFPRMAKAAEIYFLMEYAYLDDTLDRLEHIRNENTLWHSEEEYLCNTLHHYHDKETEDRAIEFAIDDWMDMYQDDLLSAMDKHPDLPRSLMNKIVQIARRKEKYSREQANKEMLENFQMKRRFELEAAFRRKGLILEVSQCGDK